MIQFCDGCPVTVSSLSRCSMLGVLLNRDGKVVNLGDVLQHLTSVRTSSHVPPGYLSGWPGQDLDVPAGSVHADPLPIPD